MNGKPQLETKKVPILSRICNRIQKEILRHPLYKKALRKSAEWNHRRALFRLRKKEKINVAFLLINLAQWKYEKLYFLMKEDDRFHPVVFICPFTLYTAEIMKDELKSCYQYFHTRGYEVVRTLGENGDLLNIKKEFRPDLVFFTSSWPHTYKPYLISNFLDKLTAYVAYFYNTSSITHKSYNQPINNLSWKIFVETEYHRTLAEKHSSNQGKNVVITGYPGLDVLMDPQHSPQDPWKPQAVQKKRVIWAPHHTLPGHQEAVFSNFFEYAEEMLKIAEDYRDRLQIAFKPHPNLRGKLYEDEKWGKKRTDAYYEQWEKQPNGQLEEGEYTDLFLTSDAMIHDSRSFIVEYLATQKPVLFLVRNGKVKEDTNAIGLKAFEKMYIGNNKKDILVFIDQIVLEGRDEKKEERVAFLDQYIKPPNNQSASKNIFDYIKSQLGPFGKKPKNH